MDPDQTAPLASSGSYTESIPSKYNPYSPVEKCAMIIFDNKINAKNKVESRRYPFY